MTKIKMPLQKHEMQSDVNTTKNTLHQGFKAKVHFVQNPIGMTIVEIMIVLTIIASLMAVVGFYAFGYLDSANNSEAQIRVKRLTDNVNMYYLSSSPKALPGSLDDLTRGPAKLLDKNDPDPWGNPYVYTKRGNRDFEIRSSGPDGQPNTGDDICADGPCSEAE